MSERRINIVQGDYAVSGRPDDVISTLLGSCVAVCLHDEKVMVGGMNHYLLPGEGAQGQLGLNARYGVNLMELLINGLFKLGATRSGLTAKIFGGANTVEGLGDIGAMNAEFARNFLAVEGIRIAGGDTGGHLGRKIQFWPATGRARQMMVRPPKPAAQLPNFKSGPSDAGELELF